MKNIDFETYQSPFTWRYGTEKMREIFSEANKRKTWRRVWVALAKSQFKEGLLTKQELEEIQKASNQIDIKASIEVEKETHHDLMAELKTFSKQTKAGGGKLHLGATSQDIEDNADILIYKEAVKLIEESLASLLKLFGKKIEENSDLVCMAYTHLQPAEPTTLGYRFSYYAQNLILDLELLKFVKERMMGKGTKGAVGNYASYTTLIKSRAKEMEKMFLEDLGIEAFSVASQVYPRKIDFFILSLLSSIAQSLNKFAFDLRIMQSSGFGEWREPFGKNQVGSSAMPFKRNPIKSERICSIARYISGLPQMSWESAANNLLERTLDDSAIKRIIMPEGFLALDEILKLSSEVLENLEISSKNIKENLTKYGPFSALEKIMLSAVKNGANRQSLHEILREHSMDAYKKMENSRENPLINLVKKDSRVSKYLKPSEIEKLFEFKDHIGLAKEKSHETARRIRKLV